MTLPAYLWSADGSPLGGWSADGFRGWSADGYEPTTLAVATAVLAALGLNVGVLTYAFSSVVPVGYVINGYPASFGEPAGSYIPLTISNGPSPTPRVRMVPNLVGKFYYDAQLEILRRGLLTAQPTFVLSSSVLPQYVISQSIIAGSQVAEQTQVTIVVSGFPVTNQPGVVIGVP
jgi:beta-lactam-binding protein with PASTA domain